MPSITNKFVCVVGASAGGLDAISKLLAQLPKEQQDLAVIVAQHLSPTHKSRLVDLLQKATSWSVEEKLNEALLHNAIDTYLFTERKPINTEVMEMIEGDKPKLKERRTTINRIIDKMVDFVDTFIGGMGE